VSDQQLEQHCVAPTQIGCEVTVSAEPRGAIKVQTQFTSGFGTWRARHRVSRVCSTYQTGHLLFVGVCPDGAPVPSAAGFSGAMGLVAFSQRIYVGTENEVWRLENVQAANEIDTDMFDRLYVPRNAQLTGDINIHEKRVEPGRRVLIYQHVDLRKAI
jgi:uncharacterized protein (TIGR03032 family)